jgi:hypothetical protein
MEHDREYYINTHELNRNRISGSREKQGGVITLFTPHIVGNADE